MLNAPSGVFRRSTLKEKLDIAAAPDDVGPMSLDLSPVTSTCPPGGGPLQW
jgi:hypothetical protein